MFLFGSLNFCHAPNPITCVCACKPHGFGCTFWASAGTWASWLTGLWPTSELKAHRRQEPRREEQCCQAVPTCLFITRSAWCSAPSWALESLWSPSQPSSKNSWESMLGRFSLETCPSKNCPFSGVDFVTCSHASCSSHNGSSLPCLVMASMCRII